MPNIATNYWNDFTHLIFPHNCEGCGTDVLEKTQHLCAQCFVALPETGFLAHAENPVARNFYGRIPLQQAGAAFFFTKESMLQHLIFQLKYRGNTTIGVYLGNLLGKYLAASPLYNTVDALVPLPLNSKKERKRGYNQAKIICEGIAEVWNKPILDQAVIRKVFTKTQTHENRINRWQNMEGVFAVAQPEAIAGKHILLVDDVVTTGATLEACGTPILEVENTQLSIATVAYTI
jgi:ComF family protein